MSDFGASIVGGVVAGLLTSVLIFIGAVLLRKCALPWLEECIYRGIRVDGSWSIVDQRGKNGESLYSQNETLEIEQVANRLSGRVILVPKEGESLKTRTLKVEGHVQDRFVMIRCSPSGRGDLGYQVFLGEISGDGTLLNGQASYYDIEDGGVQAVKCVYKREVS
jgi:hypothetical protein